MGEDAKPRLVGINHVALEVGSVVEALAFYGQIFQFKLRGGDFGPGRNGIAFIDMGDQFIALSEGRTQTADVHRHFGLVVDDRSHIRERAEAAGATLLEGPTLDFLDPWGNRIQVVEYGDIQFSKTKAVLNAMRLDLEKTDEARAELRKKGIEA